MPTPKDRAIAREVLAERDRQDAKWGEQNHPDLHSGYLGLAETVESRLSEHALFAELAGRYKQLNHIAALTATIDWTGILLEEVYEALAESDPALLRAELLQVAAVAQQWASAIDRRSPAPVQREPFRRFLPAHAYVVFLLSETAGATHTRLERLWAQKTARAGDLAWPFVSGSGLRTRVAELVAWGLVEWSGDLGRTVSNRPSKVWRLTGAAETQIPGFEPGVYDVLRRLRKEAGSDLVTVTAIEGVASAAGVRL